MRDHLLRSAISLTFLTALVVATGAGAQDGASPPAPPLLSSPPALQASPPPPRADGATMLQIEGMILANDGQQLTVRLRQPNRTHGTPLQAPVDQTVTLDPRTIIVRHEVRKLADIRPGDFLTIAALQRADGSLHAAHINLLADTLPGKGVAEGRAADLGGVPGRSNINGIVTEADPNGRGATVKVKYHGADPPGAPSCNGYATATAAHCEAIVEIAIPPGVPVIGIADGDPALLVSGVLVSIAAMQFPDGVEKAYAITIE